MYNIYSSSLASKMFADQISTPQFGKLRDGFSDEQCRTRKPVIAGMGMVVMLAISTTTAFQDPWVVRRNNTDGISTGISRSTARKILTLDEAVQLASRVLHQAESARTRAAKIEAASMWSLEDIQ